MNYVLEDTSNKPAAHPQDFEMALLHGCRVLHQALPVGDYCLAGEGYWTVYDLHRKEVFTDAKYHGGDPNAEIAIPKMDLVGTYSIAVDVKQSMDELSKNLMYTRKGNRYRFERELLRAKNMGVKLYVVVSDAHIHSEADIQQYVSYSGKQYGDALMERMRYLVDTYGCSFLFVDKLRLATVIPRCLEQQELGKFVFFKL